MSPAQRDPAAPQGKGKNRNTRRVGRRRKRAVSDENRQQLRRQMEVAEAAAAKSNHEDGDGVESEAAAGGSSMCWRDAAAPQLAGLGSLWGGEPAAGEADSDADESDGSVRAQDSDFDSEDDEPPQPMPLLPGEQPLAAEAFLGLTTTYYAGAADDVGADVAGAAAGSSRRVGCYAQYQHEAARAVSRKAETAFKATAAGKRPLAQLPIGIEAALSRGGRAQRRTLQYAAALREGQASEERVARGARKYGRHALRVCRMFEEYCQGDKAVVGPGDASSGEGKPALQQSHKAKTGSSKGGSTKGKGASCLPRTSAEAHVYALAYVRLMHELFGELVHQPLVLPSTVLEAADDSKVAEVVQRARDLCKRFVVFQHPDSWQEAQAAATALLHDGVPVSIETQALRAIRQQQEETAAAGAAQAPAGKKMQTSQGSGGDGAAAPAALSHYLASVDEWGRPSVRVQGEGGTERAAGTPWDQSLLGIANNFTGLMRRPGQKYRDVNFDGDLDTRDLSCNLLYGAARHGDLRKKTLAPTALVGKALSNALDVGHVHGNLYATDLTQPHYTDEYPRDAPGVCCSIDNQANAMLPEALRTQRGTNANNLIKNESTGVCTCTGYSMLGCRPACTAMHQETLLVPSVNLGSGDLIIQLLTSIEAVRLLHRLHAAVVGKFVRHRALLPPHMYLLHDVPLVLHLRDEGFASVAEFPQASCHAVVTFGSQQSYPPTTKIAFNDIDTRSQVAPAYYSNLLATLYSDVIPEEGHPPDSANQWMESGYLPQAPCTLQGRRAMRTAGSFPPWKEEWDGGGEGSISNDDSDGDDEEEQQRKRRLKKRQQAWHLRQGRRGSGHGDDVSTPVPLDSPTAEEPPPPPQQQLEEEEQEEEAPGSPRRSGRARRTVLPVPGQSGGEQHRASPSGSKKRKRGAAQPLAEGDEGGSSSSMDMVVVRLAEKLLDIARGRIVHGMSWSRGIPSRTHCLQSLADMLPLLRHLQKRAQPEQAGEDPRAFLRRLPPGAAPVSARYLRHLVKRVEAQGPHGLEEQLAAGRFAGAPLQGLPPTSGKGAQDAACPYAAAAVRAPWVLDAYIKASKAGRKLIREAAAMSEEQLPALGAHVVRGHWLLACHRECEVLQRSPLNWARLAQARHRRAGMERLCGQASDALAKQVLAGLEVEEHTPAASM